MHLTHRGVNRAAIFLETADYLEYRRLLCQVLGEFKVSVHAYVLMTNHVHLLVSSACVGAVSRAMSVLGKHYVPDFNRKYRRTGTLWEGRFKSCLVDSDDYLLRVYRYIELNPVRAAMVERAEDYRWSSVHSNLGAERDPLVTPHPVFTAFAMGGRGTANPYQAWLQEGIGPGDLAAIRTHLQQERVLGSERFQRMIGETLNRPVAVRPRGRPRRLAPASADRD
jgi:putative transposase